MSYSCTPRIRIASASVSPQPCVIDFSFRQDSANQRIIYALHHSLPTSPTSHAGAASLLIIKLTFLWGKSTSSRATQGFSLTIPALDRVGSPVAWSPFHLSKILSDNKLSTKLHIRSISPYHPIVVVNIRMRWNSSSSLSKVSIFVFFDTYLSHQQSGIHRVPQPMRGCVLPVCSFLVANGRLGRRFASPILLSLMTSSNPEYSHVVSSSF